jgi:hypothetical protein
MLLTLVFIGLAERLRARATHGVRNKDGETVPTAEVDAGNVWPMALASELLRILDRSISCICGMG